MRSLRDIDAERRRLKDFEEKVKEMGPIDASQKGMIMSSLMKELKGKADGMLVKEILEELVK
jgi:uncharacterized protein YqeY